ncbi:MAG: MIP family channel protein [Lachnospiraceae bacterium]|nr:MIP family channel protein [Lachnospiraceae bacterium]
MKKYIAECLGTFTLVFLGCGTAMTVGCDAANGSGYLLTALAFGLTIVGMAYAVGNVSGCHINPAVSIGCLVTRRMEMKDFIGYVIAQFVGATIGAAILKLIFSMGNITDMTGGLGSNGIAGVGNSYGAAILVEIILTCLFVYVILGVTDEKAGHGSFGGLIIGFTLVVIHILGIGLTGTSVNPARSFGPALIAAIAGNPDPIKVVWIFILAPAIGGALAGIIYNVLNAED